MAIQKTKRASGDTKFRACWRNPFTRKLEYGPWGSQDKAEQLNELQKYRLKYERDHFRPVPVEAFTSDELTISDICAAYNKYGELTDSTRQSDFYHLKAIDAFIGDLFISELTRKHMKGLEESLRKKGNKQNTINRKVSIVRSALDWAADEARGLIPENPIEGYVCKRGKDKKFEPPTNEEAERVYTEAAPHIRRAIIIGWHTGVRIGESELFKMEWARFITRSVKDCLSDYASAQEYMEQIYQWMADKLLPPSAIEQSKIIEKLSKDRSALFVKNDIIEALGSMANMPVSGTFRIIAAQKNEDMPWREIPIEGEILNLVIAWKEQDLKAGTPWVIHYKGKQIGTMKTGWKAAKRRAEVRDDIRPYDLRHAFITYALAKGANMKAVGKLAGHADETMILRRYQHVIGGQEIEAAKAVPGLRRIEKTKDKK